MTQPPLVITDPERDRYFSSRLIPWWDQARLAAAQVMVVGAGALGNEVLKNLALLGVGRLFIVDFDRVEISNLARSVLFRASDAGRPKAMVAAERVRELNPEVAACAFHGDVSCELGLGAFRRMDVVVGCLDNREARWAVNRACWRLGKPWVDGGLDTLNGAIKVFVPPSGPCYECGLTEQERQVMALRYSCPGLLPGDLLRGRTPTTITSAAIVAGVQTQELLKLLHGIPVTPGSAFLYNGLRARVQNVQLAKREDCLAHETYSPIIELPMGVGSLSLRALLGVAERELGAEPCLRLDRQLTIRCVCSDCGAVEPIMRPYDHRLQAHPECPSCGGSRFPELTNTIHYGSPYLETTLEQVGIPQFHILSARSGVRQAYLEFTADIEEVLSYEGAYKRDVRSR